jgi:putative addiction module component (TIGR02574 family)
MNATLEQIKRQALALPAKERAELVDQLWESLGDTTYPVLNPAWQVEIARRRQALLEGKAKSTAGEEVSRRAREIVKSAHS